MKKFVGIIACCFFAQIVSAQAPKWAEKAKKAVFSVVTYDKENKINIKKADCVKQFAFLFCFLKMKKLKS